jgi:hypothetical protein
MNADRLHKRFKSDIQLSQTGPSRNRGRSNQPCETTEAFSNSMMIARDLLCVPSRLFDSCGINGFHLQLAEM